MAGETPYGRAGRQEGQAHGVLQGAARGERLACLADHRPAPASLRRDAASLQGPTTWFAPVRPEPRPGSAGAAKAQVQPERRTRRPAPHLDLIAALVHDPQPAPATEWARVRAGLPGERVLDPAAVLDLADDLVVGRPQPEGARPARVPQCVAAE